jgi:hypothetical protein
MWSRTIVSRGFRVGWLAVLLAGLACAPASAQETGRQVGSRTPHAEGEASDPAPWILAGSGAAVCLAGALLYGVGVSDIAVVDSAAPGTEWSSVAGVYESAPLLTGVGLVALATGGAMVLAGVAWRLADLLAVRGSAERAGARLWLELRGAGLSIGGRL